MREEEQREGEKRKEGGRKRGRERKKLRAREMAQQIETLAAKSDDRI